VMRECHDQSITCSLQTTVHDEALSTKCSVNVFNLEVN